MAFPRYFNAISLVLLAIYICFAPAITVLVEINDPGIAKEAIPSFAWKMHRSLTPKLEDWARQRLASIRATELSTSNISGTEWPLFGAVFYLWSTESLQAEWQKNPKLAPIAPKVYAAGAVDAATRLVIDPKQANWVKIHWGENYLKTENVFYRMLVIAALTSHARLTGSSEFSGMLKEQVETLSAELDRSRNGLLNDYPSECYPGDVLAAIAMIRNADSVLGTDHSAFVARATRAFQGRMLDSRGLVPYSGDTGSSFARGQSRGCGNSYVCLEAPTLWPELARKWYDGYVKHFWQHAWTADGFREFSKEIPERDWYMDVDSGPVLKGFGFAACAFGVGAARVNGHFEHAFPLTAEMMAVSCPLANGTLLIPRLLSNAADAPYLGEAGILYNLTRMPAPGFPVSSGGTIPGFVLIVLGLQCALGFGLILTARGSIVQFRKEAKAAVFPARRIQVAVWAALVCTAIVFFVMDHAIAGAVVVVFMQIFPRARKAVTDENVPTLKAGVGANLPDQPRHD